MTNHEERQAWLQGLKVGDLVVVDPGCGGQYEYESRIKRRTKTFLITLAGGKYRIADGRKQLAGLGGFVYPRLIEPTPELLCEIHKHTLTAKFRTHPWNRVSLDILKAIDKLLPKESPE
ncbi:MAG: hypothetical protein V3V96_14325 [Acidiferrobacterales bacterium]